MKLFIEASKINHFLKKNYVQWKLISKSKEPVKIGRYYFPCGVLGAERLIKTYQGTFLPSGLLCLVQEKIPTYVGSFTR